MNEGELLIPDSDLISICTSTSVNVGHTWFSRPETCVCLWPAGGGVVTWETYSWTNWLASFKASSGINVHEEQLTRSPCTHRIQGNIPEHQQHHQSTRLYVGDWWFLYIRTSMLAQEPNWGLTLERDQRLPPREWPSGNTDFRFHSVLGANSCLNPGGQNWSTPCKKLPHY